MVSVDSQNIVHGHPGQSPDGLNNVHRESPLSSWTNWNLSSLIWLKKNEVKVASLEMYIHIFLS